MFSNNYWELRILNVTSIVKGSNVVVEVCGFNILYYGKYPQFWLRQN